MVDGSRIEMELVIEIELPLVVDPVYVWVAGW